MLHFIFLLSIILCLHIPFFETTNLNSNGQSLLLYTGEAFLREYSIQNNVNLPGMSSKSGNGDFRNQSIELITSLAGHPDLPNWMKFYRRNGSPVGYFYGTPGSEDDGDIDIEIIAVNTFNFNTSKDRLKFRIIRRRNTNHNPNDNDDDYDDADLKNQVEMKFFDYDLQDFYEKNLSSVVLNIFRKKLWISEIGGGDSEQNGTTSSSSLTTTSTASPEQSKLYITKIVRPIELGGRFPLDPAEKEGVAVRIGSNGKFSPQLLRLEAEAKLIKNRNPCPKRYKASTVEYIFREKKLRVDWCSFRLLRH